MSVRVLRIVGIGLAVVAIAWLFEWGYQVRQVLRDTEVTHAPGLSVSTILGPTELQDVGEIGEDFDVTSNGTVVLRGDARLFEIAPDAGQPIDLAMTQVPDSFAFDTRDAMLTVSDGFLGVLSAEGKPIEGVPLFDRNARLAGSFHPGTVYLFGGNGDRYRLYRFLEDGTFQVLLEIDKPPVSVTDGAQGTYVATRDRIYRIAWPDPVLVFKAPEQFGWGPIRSVAAGDDGLLFFSTANAVYALKGGVAVSVVNDSGGSIRRRGDDLYVLDDRRRLLYSLRPASMAIFRENAQ